ncbi:Raffinose synthase [Corchorus capsularis]|uniref:galactinol--sucrose galactosyltransferase n=1 Tax=Corchorus capsularis TaxID=210143 RepID=A0A1R3FVN4_COCAP|nr:Raffinose synthase [Corchorus capsularis]
MGISLTKKAADSTKLHDNQQLQTCVTLAGTNFLANGHPFLTQVPSNIVATPGPSPFSESDNKGCFVGFNAEEPSSRHVVPIGKLSGIKFTSIFRFKLWWSTHWVGTSGKDVEFETQLMILDKSDHLGRPYVILLPIIEGCFSTSLQPGFNDDSVNICVESGSTKVCGSSFKSCLYIHVDNDDPFNLVKEAMKVARFHLGTFRLLQEKSPPEIIDKFGWCTWNAFYRYVNPRGIWDGVKALEEAGCPPGMVLIDDGWQSVSLDDDPIEKEGIDRAAAGEEMGSRLAKFQENYKFEDYQSIKTPGNRGMGAFVRDLKEEFKTIENVYVWHALCGFWGGIRPNVPGMPESKMVKPIVSPSVQQTMEDFAMDNTMRDWVGLVVPEQADKLFQGLHSHLESLGIDGVKIDMIEVLELLSEDFGGRVELAKAYYNALTASLTKHFKENAVISSMQQANPYGDPTGKFWLQGCHMVHCAYNSLWMGNFIQPDWDMFQSDHQCAEFHAASRAISGGPIYVSDSVGRHNFDLLRKLGLPDGTILRCQHYALPTRDCLFEDPLQDGNTALKIWNLNKYSGVLGLFNCQGGGWSRELRRTHSAPEFAKQVHCFASPKDIEWNNGKNPISVESVSIFAVYMYQSKKLKLMKSYEKMEVTLEPLNYELLTVSPVAILPKKQIQFAPIGLVNMLNSGGAIQSLAMDGNENVVRIGVKGRGELRVFASEKPWACKIDGKPFEFGYDEQMVRVEVPWIDSPLPLMVEYFF